jgi:competence protein ComFC
MPGWIHPLFSYKDKVVRNAIWHLKYKNTRGLGAIFARHLYEYILEFFGDDYQLNKKLKIIVVPIPLTQTRERTRGYNQSEIIARSIVAHDHDKVFIHDNASLGRKESDVRQSHTKNKKERERNIVDCFYAKKPENIKGKIILLIDDVVTTGATLREARKVLLEAGAKKVIAFTVAH